MAKKRYDVSIGPNYDMFIDGFNHKRYDSFDVVEILNYYDEENKKLSKALHKVINKNIELEREIQELRCNFEIRVRRIEHENYGAK